MWMLINLQLTMAKGLKSLYKSNVWFELRQGPTSPSTAETFWYLRVLFRLKLKFLGIKLGQNKDFSMQNWDFCLKLWFAQSL
jgi:hypothetical protein